MCQQSGFHFAQAHLVTDLPFAEQVCAYEATVVGFSVVGVGQLVVAVGSPVGVDLGGACGNGTGLVDSVAGGDKATVVHIVVGAELHLRAGRDGRLVAARGCHEAVARHSTIGGSAALGIADVEVHTVVEDNQRVALLRHGG